MANIEWRSVQGLISLINETRNIDGLIWSFEGNKSFDDKEKDKLTKEGLQKQIISSYSELINKNLEIINLPSGSLESLNKEITVYSSRPNSSGRDQSYGLRYYVFYNLVLQKEIKTEDIISFGITEASLDIIQKENKTNISKTAIYTKDTFKMHLEHFPSLKRSIPCDLLKLDTLFSTYLKPHPDFNDYQSNIYSQVEKIFKQL
jgi:hypothetical protein